MPVRVGMVTLADSEYYCIVVCKHLAPVRECLLLVGEMKPGMDVTGNFINSLLGIDE